jgi:hypothetical protein
MRWKINSDPNVGDKREQIRFAWLPTSVINVDENNQEYIIWLSIYIRKQEYMKWTACAPGYRDGMRVIGWRTTDRIIHNIGIGKKW